MQQKLVNGRFVPANESFEEDEPSRPPLIIIFDVLPNPRPKEIQE